MKLKLVGFNTRDIPSIHKIVKRGEVFEVKDDLGVALLKHNVGKNIVWERVTSTKKEAS